MGAMIGDPTRITWTKDVLSKRKNGINERARTRFVRLSPVIASPMTEKTDTNGKDGLLDQIKASIVAISLRGFPHGEGLGVLCGRWIFTCAHYFDALTMKIGYADWVEVWRVCNGTVGTFAVLHASTLDFMILAPDGMTLNSSEAGGTETSWDVIHSYAETHSELCPAEILFQSDATSADLPGFFFVPDGKTLHRAKFQLSKSSAFITF